MSASHFLRLGAEKYHDHQYELAIDAFRQSIALGEDWQSYYGLGLALEKTNQYQQAVDAFRQSLALKEDWRSYRDLGISLYHLLQYQLALDALKQSLSLNKHFYSYLWLGHVLISMQQYQLAVDALKQSILMNKFWLSYFKLGSALINTQDCQLAVDSFKYALMLSDDNQPYQGLGDAFLKQGKSKHATRVAQIIYRQDDSRPHLEIDPFLGEESGVVISRDLIKSISERLSRFQYAFYPSFLSEEDSDGQLDSWKHLIHVHIPKCAGTNFEAPLTKLPNFLKTASKNQLHDKIDDSRYRKYLWHGNLGGKHLHDAYL